jgi:NAD(P)-dependent dehydrogenase (short-subunit alcohol dehydrogenase family)/acyl carrier protein
VLAKYLAQAVQAKLVLIGRSAFPDAEGWEQWIASHDDHDPVSHKIRHLQAIEQCGGQVMVISADVANQHQMQEAIHVANERFGHIHGVIHAAGIAGGGIIQLKPPEQAARVLAPKVQGTVVLNALFKGVDLDFFLLCSSITSILGGSGQVDYCGANAFLDAFAYGNDSSDGRLLVSINWDTWQEVGMAVNTAVPKALEAQRRERLQRGILSSEAMDVFARILGTTVSQVVVATSDFRSVKESNNPHATSPAVEEPKEDILSGSSSSRHAPTHLRPALGNPYVAPRNEIEQTIADIWQELLGIDRVGIHDNFLDLGGHSLMALQVTSRLRRVFQAELSVRVFFEVPTVVGLAEAIEKAKDQAEQAEHEKMARLLAEVEGLPDEEARRLLADGHE